MRKIVVNKCCGGYSLSPTAVKRLAELQGHECYFFKSTKIGSGEYELIRDPDKEFMWYAFSVSNPNEYLQNNKDWNDMTNKERVAHNKRYEEINLDQRPANREDPLLISVVEELGDKANGQYADLRIVEIPEEAEYRIDEYDGIETVYYGTNLGTA